MAPPRLTDAGARLSWLVSDAASSAQRSALGLFGFVVPSAIVLALCLGDAASRPLALALAITLTAGQLAYLHFGAPGSRGWGFLAVAVPLTLGVTTLAMRTDSEVLLPLLFTSVCWSALSLPGTYVVANLVATVTASAVPVAARALGWRD